MSREVSFYMAYLRGQGLREEILKSDLISNPGLISMCIRTHALDAGVEFKPDASYVTTTVTAYLWSHIRWIPGEDHGVTVERFAAWWLDGHPHDLLYRDDGEIVIYGADHLGRTWRLSLGAGVCKLVQVGTEKKLVPDPSVVVPKVEIEVPVYKKTCGDPLADLAMTR